MKVNAIYARTGFIIILGFILFNSCSTKKNTFTRRFYHNMTARYNGYFNGNESYKTGVFELEKLHVDDYSKILQVYKLGTLENATSLSSNFDVAYTKASTVITRHSIFIRKKEHVRLVPEAYMLIGKAYFYKQEYKLASETFDYIIKTYGDFPVKYNALVWLAKTYNQLKKYDKAESTLDLAQTKMDKNKKLIPKQVLKDFPIVYADFHMKKESYEQAIEYLMAAIDKNKKKAVRTRLTFILAQMYQEMGRMASATQLYDKVIKMNPPYEMAFNAKINKAICFDAGAGDSKEIIKLLNKMARDVKNKDYLDQIFYALAEICMKEKDTACAIENYKLSATKSVANKNQKATSYLKLAKLYFSMPEYELAEMYYDSTMTVLPKVFPDYDNISALSDILKDLVKNLKVVTLQDSLQKLSKMTPEQKNKIIDGIITEVIKKEQKEKEEAYQKQVDIYNANISANTSTSSGWYFYNSTAMNFGKTEFMKKWGNRKLEDLWRLSNKAIQSDFGITDDQDTVSSDSSKAATANNLKDKNYYLKDIPVTAEDIKLSDKQIVAALYNIALIYQSDLLDVPKAVSTYETLLKRFPLETDYVMKTYYQLYAIYDNMYNNSKSDYYKNLICTKDPESDYCNIIKNPNYKKITSENKDIAVTLYKETYTAYKTGKWDSVMTKSNRAIAMFGSDTSLVPKFTYLKALAYGKDKDSLNLVKTLQLIIEKYPYSSVTLKAKDLLDFWTGKNPVAVVSAKDSSAAGTSAYLFDEEAIHFYVMVVNVSKNVKISDLKNLISDFDNKNFGTASLTISNIFLDNTRQIITVTNFPNKQKAMLYFNLLKIDKTVFAKLQSSDYQQFIISVDNYPKMYKNKDIDGYYTFFTKNYLK